MGMWDELHSSVSRFINRKPQSKHPSDANSTAFDGQRVAAAAAAAIVSKATEVADAVRSKGAQKLGDYIPDRHRREKISRVVTTTFDGRQAAAAIVSKATKVADAVRSNGAQKLDDYLPDPHSREKISRVLTNLGKLAVDSAVNESLKGVTGGVQVYRIVREGLKDQPNSCLNNGIKRQDPMVAVEEMQAKMEKMQQDVNILKQRNETCAEYSKEVEPLKVLPDDPTETSASAKTNKKKIFIRSRL